MSAMVWSKWAVAAALSPCTIWSSVASASWSGLSAGLAVRVSPRPQATTLTARAPTTASVTRARSRELRSARAYRIGLKILSSAVPGIPSGTQSRRQHRAFSLYVSALRDGNHQPQNIDLVAAETMALRYPTVASCRPNECGRLSGLRML